MQTFRNLYRPNTRFTDIGTGLPGHITSLFINGDGSVRYTFQPDGVDPTDEHPVTPQIIDPSRVPKDILADLTLDVPFEVLGTQLTHVPSGPEGYTGIAIQLVYHPDGCEHVILQKQGRVPFNNGAIRPKEFNLHHCFGPARPRPTTEKVQEEIARHPSPIDSPDFTGM